MLSVQRTRKPATLRSVFLPSASEGKNILSLRKASLLATTTRMVSSMVFRARSAATCDARNCKVPLDSVNTMKDSSKNPRNSGGASEHEHTNTLSALAGPQRWRRLPTRRRSRRHPGRWRLATAAELATTRTWRDACLRSFPVDRRLGDWPPPCSLLSACLARSARVSLPADVTASRPSRRPVSSQCPSPQRYRPNGSAYVVALPH
jgi:hypothetical protein